MTRDNAIPSVTMNDLTSAPPNELTFITGDGDTVGLQHNRRTGANGSNVGSVVQEERSLRHGRHRGLVKSRDGHVSRTVVPNLCVMNHA